MEGGSKRLRETDQSFEGQHVQCYGHCLGPVQRNDEDKAQVVCRVSGYVYKQRLCMDLKTNQGRYSSV